MKREELRRLVAVLREVPPELVLRMRGAERDRHDRAKWHTEVGPVSVSGSKFSSWHRGVGGGGAIDLAMHLGGMDYRAAVAWLHQHFGQSPVMVADTSTASSANQLKQADGNSEGTHSAPVISQRTDPAHAILKGARSADVAPGRLRLPVRDDRLLSRVRQYLTVRRHLPKHLVETLVASGKLYADVRGNAVFLLVAGKANRPVGAELRGTGNRVWRGLAQGTRKDLGYFWIGTPGSRWLVLCESAIDAISCYALHPDRICVSTSGARSNPRWLRGLLRGGYEIACGFDTDEAGESAAAAMMSRYAAIRRLRPPAHDWNDAFA